MPSIHEMINCIHCSEREQIRIQRNDTWTARLTTYQAQERAQDLEETRVLQPGRYLFIIETLENLRWSRVENTTRVTL